MIEGTTCGQINTLAKDSADTLGMQGTDATVTVTRGSSEAGALAFGCTGVSTPPALQDPGAGHQRLRQADFAFEPIVPFIPAPSTLTGKGVYRCEFQ